jgi:hypothetical protein
LPTFYRRLSLYSKAELTFDPEIVTLLLTDAQMTPTRTHSAPTGKKSNGMTNGHKTACEPVTCDVKRQVPAHQSELFNSGIVTLQLTESQREQLQPLVRRQVAERRGLLLCSVAPHFNNGKSCFRLQAKFLTWPAAQRVLKIVREDNEADLCNQQHTRETAKG